MRHVARLSRLAAVTVLRWPLRSAVGRARDEGERILSLVTAAKAE